MYTSSCSCFLFSFLSSFYRVIKAPNVYSFMRVVQTWTYSLQLLQLQYVTLNSGKAISKVVQSYRCYHQTSGGQKINIFTGNCSQHKTLSGVNHLHLAILYLSKLMEFIAAYKTLYKLEKCIFQNTKIK